MYEINVYYTNCIEYIIIISYKYIKNILNIKEKRALFYNNNNKKKF